MAALESKTESDQAEQTGDWLESAHWLRLALFPQSEEIAMGEPQIGFGSDGCC